MMTSVSSTRGPADYANQMREGRQGELLNDDSMLHECSFDVQVIDTDRAPQVQVHSDQDQCGQTEESSREKLREFLEDRPGFSTACWGGGRRGVSPT